MLSFVCSLAPTCFFSVITKRHTESGGSCSYPPPTPHPTPLTIHAAYLFFFSVLSSQPKNFSHLSEPHLLFSVLFLCHFFFSASVCCSVQPAFHFLFRSLASPFFLCSSSFRHSPLLFPFGKKINKSKQV